MDPVKSLLRPPMCTQTAVLMSKTQALTLGWGNPHGALPSGGSVWYCSSLRLTLQTAHVQPKLMYPAVLLYMHVRIFMLNSEQYPSKVPH